MDVVDRGPRVRRGRLGYDLAGEGRSAPVAGGPRSMDSDGPGGVRVGRIGPGGPGITRHSVFHPGSLLFLTKQRTVAPMGAGTSQGRPFGAPLPGRPRYSQAGKEGRPGNDGRGGHHQPGHTPEPLAEGAGAGAPVDRRERGLVVGAVRSWKHPSRAGAISTSVMASDAPITSRFSLPRHHGERIRAGRRA